MRLTNLIKGNLLKINLRLETFSVTHKAEYNRRDFDDNSYNPNMDPAFSRAIGFKESFF